MRIIVRTVYGSALQTAKQLGIAHDVPDLASLNRALDYDQVVPHQPTLVTQGMEVVAPYIADDDTIAQTLQYFCIGNGGHRTVAGPVNGVPYTAPIPHRASDAGLYNLIPFVVKPVAADLTDLERSIYRLRKTMLIDGTLYAAYYLRQLDIASATADATEVTVVGGVSYPIEFIPTLNNLTPPIPPIGSANNGSYLQVSATINVTFSAQEVQWLKDACALVFGDENYAIISEIGLCHGVEHPVTAVYPATGSQVAVAVSTTNVECVGVQVACHISTYYPVIYTNAGFDFTLELGATEPLFGLDA